MRVLLVSKDSALAEGLEAATMGAGHSLLVRDEPARVQLPRGIALGLVLYDLGEGTPAHWKWLDQWLQAGSLPLIVLGPTALCASDPVRALHMGADDYVPRPIYLEELALRIDTVARRARAVSADAAETVGKGDLELDPDTCSVGIDGRHVKLTPTEFRLLEKLACQEGHPVRRQILTSHVWGGESAVTDTTLSLYIWNLRQKLEADPTRPRLIVTRRGLGYVFQRRLVLRDVEG
jgi:DNA-binding response OmpR family regulator